MGKRERDRILSDDGLGESFATILARRLSRRDFLKMIGLTVTSAAVPSAAVRSAHAATPGTTARHIVAGIPFKAIKPVVRSAGRPVIAKDHTLSVLIRWGDPLFNDSPVFDPAKLSAAAQARQFGYNCDFVGLLSHPDAPRDARRGVMVVNHEYTRAELMFANYRPTRTTRAIADLEMAAHGLSIFEVVQAPNGTWSVATGSKYNRRITATTPMTADGPAAGSHWLKTPADDSGRNIAGTLNNCAGGKTPWGTVLSAEENFHLYFGNAARISNPRVKGLNARYGVPLGATDRRWERFYDRFDMSVDPNEINRFGWIVEIDPSDPTSTPVKHTALGRVNHEAATFALCRSGQAAFYSGDDERFDYVYKFVSRGIYDPADRRWNMGLLSEGTLYVARFNDDGTGEWLALVYGRGRLTRRNGFASQADVAVWTRQAADLLGATKMDRPEDIEQNPVTRKVYMVMANNYSRGTPGRPAADRANPRPNNRAGHIIEVTEEDHDAAATRFTWEVFMLCGDPRQEVATKPETRTYFAGFDKTKVSPIAAPDNITFDLDGNLWIATDGQPDALSFNDGMYAVPVEGPNRGEIKQFFSTVVGSEICGPEFTADNTSLFLAIQHPGEGRGSKFELPLTRWPDYKRGMPPRPSVVVLQNVDPRKRVGAS